MLTLEPPVNSGRFNTLKNELTAAGQMFNHLKDNLLGMSALDIDATTASSDVHGFSDGSSAVLFVSSLQESTQSVDFDFSLLIPYYSALTTTRIGLEVGSTDGLFKKKTDWDQYHEPDANLSFTNEIFGTPLSGDVSFSLGAYEIVMFEFTLTTPPTTYGSNSEWDTITGTHYSETIDGKTKVVSLRSFKDGALME